MQSGSAPTHLTPKQIEVLGLLLSGDSITSVSKSTGVHRSTIYLWRQDDDFRAFYENARVHRALNVHDRASALADSALLTLSTILADNGAPAAIRLRAAQTVLKLALEPLSAAPIQQNSTKFDITGQNAEVTTPTPATAASTQKPQSAPANNKAAEPAIAAPVQPNSTKFNITEQNAEAKNPQPAIVTPAPQASPHADQVAKAPETPAPAPQSALAA